MMQQTFTEEEGPTDAFAVAKGKQAIATPFATPSTTYTMSPALSSLDDPLFARCLSGDSTFATPLFARTHSESIEEESAEDADWCFVECAELPPLPPMSPLSSELGLWAESVVVGQSGENVKEVLKSAHRERLASELARRSGEARAQVERGERATTIPGEGVLHGRFGSDGFVYDCDGTAWVSTTGQGAAQSKEQYMARMSTLEEKLAEVKALYVDKVGEDPDCEDAEFQYGYDSDGTMWLGTIGQGDAKQQEKYENRLDLLLNVLDEVKSLYSEKFDDQVHESQAMPEYAYDEDGTAWSRIGGDGAAVQREAYFSRVCSLEDLLAEVKLLYASKYGDAADEVAEQQHGYDADGTLWVGTVGQGEARQREQYSDRVDRLLAMLDDVKDLYEEKSGDRYDGDIEEPESMRVFDKEGMPWQLSVGRGIQHQRDVYAQKMTRLEHQLCEVKALYTQRYGEDVDGEAENQYGYDADGTLWYGLVGQGAQFQRTAYDDRVERLLSMLDDVKTSYGKKYGAHFLDLDEDAAAAEWVEDKDGTAWRVTVGVGSLRQRDAYTHRLGALEEKLAGVKELYKDKCGEDIDASDAAHQHGYDEDGTMWFGVVGQGADVQQRAYQDRLDNLFRSLDDVKLMYEQQYGTSVDDHEIEHQHGYDADGMLWVGTVGQGVQSQKEKYDVRVQRLFDQLDEVKVLYKARLGVSVDVADEPPRSPLRSGSVRAAALKRCFRARQARRQARQADDKDRDSMLCAGPDGKVFLGGAAHRKRMHGKRAFNQRQ